MPADAIPALRRCPAVSNIAACPPSTMWLFAQLITVNPAEATPAMFDGSTMTAAPTWGGSEAVAA